MSTHHDTRVLIVDDNREAAELLRDLLAIEGYTTATAFDGYMALDVALSFAPHIIILDLGMPKFSGDEVALMLRQVSKFEDVYLIALTAWGDSRTRDLTSRSGFNLHLTKPVQLPELFAGLEAGRQAQAAAADAGTDGAASR